MCSDLYREVGSQTPRGLLSSNSQLPSEIWWQSSTFDVTGKSEGESQFYLFTQDMFTVHHLCGKYYFRCWRCRSIMTAKSSASVPERGGEAKQKEEERNNKSVTEVGLMPGEETLGWRFAYKTSYR